MCLCCFVHALRTLNPLHGCGIPRGKILGSLPHLSFVFPINIHPPTSFHTPYQFSLRVSVFIFLKDLLRGLELRSEALGKGLLA